MTGINGRNRIAVVGAGPGGLTASALLSHRGFEVDIYEQKDRVGGRNACLELGPYKFDVGPTFLMMRHILDEVFEEAGSSTENELDMMRLDPMYRLEFADMTLNCTSDHVKMREELDRVAPGKGKRFEKFYANEAKRFGYMAPCLQQPYQTLGAYFSKNLLKAMPHLSLHKSVYDVLKGYFGEQDLALSFSFQSKYLGMSPWECPGTFAMLAYIEYAFGVFHIRGGLSEISARLADRSVKNGANLHLETPVKSILIENGRARGVELQDGEKREYDDVIINADFSHAMQNLVPEAELRRWGPQQLKKKRYSCSTFMLYLGLDKLYDQPHHTIYMAPDYKQNVEDIFQRKSLSDETSFYIRNASITDPTLAPEGHSALYVLVPVANLRAGVNWQREAPAFRRKVLDQIKARTGWSDLEDHIQQERVITPADWESDFSVYEGATFNLAHNLMQMLYFRPHNRFEEFENCYLTGGGTHPGSGVPTILESGRIVANLLSRKYGMTFESRNPYA